MSGNPAVNPRIPSMKAKVWRYMDLAQFVSLLDRGALYFAPIADLGDPFEAHYTNKDVRMATQRYEDLRERERIKEGIKSERHFKMFQIMKTVQGNKLAKARGKIFVNCWHVLEYESAAMWKVYAAQHHGVAVQSTFNRLSDCLDACKEYNIAIGRVRYIDYDRERIRQVSPLWPCFYKRRSFRHEKELRAVIFPANNPALNSRPEDTGLYVDVDVKRLILNVYVSPNASCWVVEVVRSVTVKYGLEGTVVKQSRMGAHPLTLG